MKDKILKALDLCIDWQESDCTKCPYRGKHRQLLKDIRGLINEQEKEIEQAYEQAKKDIIELIISGI